jgi:hypothetical protein
MHFLIFVNDRLPLMEEGTLVEHYVIFFFLKKNVS